MDYVIRLLEKEIYLINYRIKNDLVSQGQRKDLDVRKQWLKSAIDKLRDG